MSLRLKCITLDCSDPYRLAEFWARLTGYAEDPDNLNSPADPEALLLSPDGSPALLFITVPESKQVKNRLHLDLVPHDGPRDDAVAELLSIGATLVDDRRRPDGTGWVVLADPEGNEFCVERSAAERFPAISDLGLAFDAVGNLIESVAPEQWGAPTPCADWPIRKLAHHLIGLNRTFLGLLSGQPADRSGGELPDDDLLTAYRDSAARLLTAFARSGVLTTIFTGPLGSATGAERVAIRRYDLLAHGWDLARAIGRPFEVPAELAEQSLAFARTQLTDDARPGRFAPATPIDANAPAIDRLAAFLGRPVTE